MMLRCPRCGGNLLLRYEEGSCLQCSHTITKAEVDRVLASRERSEWPPRLNLRDEAYPGPWSGEVRGEPYESAYDPQ